MLRAIIADDERKICQLLRVLVDWESLGFEIVGEEHDGESLLRATHALQPDVIVTDIQMPGMSGLELLHAIRQEQLDIDIVIMSGYREFDYVRSSLRDGASDYLLKPISREGLREALLRIRQRRESAMKDREYVQNIQQTLQSYSRQLQQDLVRDVLDGRLVQAGEDELNEKYGCGFHGMGLFFAAVKSDLDGEVLQKTDEVVRQKVGDIVGDRMQKMGLRYFSGSRENVEYILVEAQDQDALEDGLYHLIHALREYFCKWNAGHVTVGLVPVEQGRLALAMEQSRAAVLDQVFRGVDKVLTYRQVQRGTPPVFVDKRTLREMHAALVIPSGQKLRGAIDGALRSIWEHGSALQSGQAVYDGCAQLQSQLAQVCMDIYEDKAVADQLQRWQTRLHSCWDWKTYRKLFADETEALTETIEQVQRQKEKMPVRRMRQIMQERYREQLTLEQLAEQMEMSPAYVSKLFKKEIGENFTQHLNTLRLNEAKRLLATTTDSAAQIAAAIGYNDEKYFLRLFKKEVGLTTSEYRRLHGG